MEEVTTVDTDDCTCMVVWSGAVILFLDIMKSLLVPPPPVFMVVINFIFASEMYFSGRVHNMANGE
jgi:hypothetical protein